MTHFIVKLQEFNVDSKNKAWLQKLFESSVSVGFSGYYLNHDRMQGMGKKYQWNFILDFDFKFVVD